MKEGKERQQELLKYTLYFRFLFQRNIMHSGVNLLLWDTVKVTQLVLIVHVGMTQVVQNVSLESRQVFCGRLITIKCYLWIFLYLMQILDFGLFYFSLSF